MARPPLSARRSLMESVASALGHLDPLRRLARERARGGTDDGAGLRPAAARYLAMLAVAAWAAVAVALADAGLPDRSQGALALTLAGAMALGGLRPLPFAAGTKLAIDTSVLVAAVLLFDPAMAMLVTGSGKLLAQALRRQPRDQTVFNVAQTVLLAAGGGQVLAAGGWHAGHLGPVSPESLLLVVALGVVLWLLNTLAVAAIVALQTGDAPARVWSRVAVGGGPADALAHFVQVGLGVLVAGVADGSARPLALLLVPAGTAYPALAHHLRERRRADAALAHRATHDPLTDLPNRTLLLERLAGLLGPSARPDTLVGVLFVDLDRFKFVNDSLGHEAGDTVLVAVAARLRECSRPGDTVARLGGDEFVVLLKDLPDRSVAEGVAERFATSVAAPVALDGHDVTVSASVGIALVRPGHATPTDALRNADAALRQAKEGGKARYVVYEPWMGARLRERVALEAELRRALGREELRLAYQPIVEVATGRIEGLEVLVRWQHPERGILLPGAFVALAEETGLIGPIGGWVLAAACRQGRAWQDRFPAPPVVGVNLSARQFQQPDLVGSVERALREAGLDPALLRLELTESAVMADPSGAAATLRRLKGLGVQLALDDFGTGHSSLGSLRRFPIDLLKIDRGFVAGLERDAGDEAIVRAVVAMAPALGLRVAAEGVETRGQLARLRDLRCELGQGYHFAHPLPAEAVTALLDEARVATRPRLDVAGKATRARTGAGAGRARSDPPVRHRSRRPHVGDGRDAGHLRWWPRAQCTGDVGHRRLRATGVSGGVSRPHREA